MHVEVPEKFSQYLSRPEIEGTIKFMYTDYNGYVTVGIGMMIDTPQELHRFKHRQLWEAKPGVEFKPPLDRLTDAQFAQKVQDDYDEVKKIANTVRREGLADPKHKKNLEFKHKGECAAKTKLQLTDAGLAMAFQRQLDVNMKFIRKSLWFRNWDSYPGDAQMVLLDLAWGAPGALASGARWGGKDFGPLCKACSKKDFLAASGEVLKYDASYERTKERKIMFVNAAIVMRLKWPVTHVYYPIDLDWLERRQYLPP